MKVVEITVHAGRKFNHPYEQYSNLSPGVTLRAELVDGEGFEEAVRQLQGQAETLVEDHKQAILRDLAEVRAMSQRETTLARLDREIKDRETLREKVRNASPKALAQMEGQVDDLPF